MQAKIDRVAFWKNKKIGPSDIYLKDTSPVADPPTHYPSKSQISKYNN